MCGWVVQSGKTSVRTTNKPRRSLRSALKHVSEFEYRQTSVLRWCMIVLLPMICSGMFRFIVLLSVATIDRVMCTLLGRLKRFL